MGKLIPFNLPYVPEASKRYVLEALESNHQQGDGPFTARASKMISDLVGGGHVLLTPSCTHALEMASMLVNLGPGDEVILPSYTFTSAATAITKFGATPVFVDIEMETRGIDLNQVREVITSKTKAISWVNYAGLAPDIEGLQSLAKEFDLLLIEDNAHGLGGSYKGSPLGSFGDFATQSFHATKNIQCGEGGALIINNSEYVQRAEIIREKGTDRSRFLLGQVEKYQWVDNGSSYLLAESLAAVLVGQLECIESIQSARRQIWNKYESLLRDSTNFEKQSSKDMAVNVAHMFYLVLENPKIRTDTLRYFRENSVVATSHYQPLHSSIAGSRYSLFKNEFHNSISLSDRILRLPVFIGLTDDEIEKITQLLVASVPS
jgi:dTDP-4-amino-4,6-dideoxygalactose transaminase